MKKKDTIIYYLAQHRFILFTCSLVVLVGILGYGYWKRTIPLSALQSSQNVKPLCKDCNIILMTLDVCSAKNMPCYGYDRNTTPNLCAFAQKNQLFLNSYANATWTLPSHVSLLTGVLPSTHGVHKQWEDSLPPSLPFLPEVLQKNGYETVLFQPKDTGIFSSKTVYNRGITEINDDYFTSSLFKRLDENVKKGKKTFFSYYISVCHEPNLVGSENKLFTTDSFPQIPIEPGDKSISFTPEFYEYLQRFLPDKLKNNEYEEYNASIKNVYDRMISSNSFEKARILFLDRSNFPNDDITRDLYWSYVYDTYINVHNKKMMNYLMALYDQQLFRLDTGDIRDFINALNGSTYKDNTVVLITSEHGQEFGEHGVFGHTTLYERNIRVPFVLSVPGVPSHTIMQPVQSVDVMPTLLDLVGITHNYIFDGKSIVPLLQNKKLSDRIIISGYEGNKALIMGDWKLLVKKDGRELIPYELFNTKIDPSEVYNTLASKFSIANDILRKYSLQYPKNTR